MSYPKDIMEEVLYTQEEVVSKAKELAERINRDYLGKPLTVVCTLKFITFDICTFPIVIVVFPI